MDAIQRDKCFARRLARSGCVKALGIVRVRRDWSALLVQTNAQRVMRWRDRAGIPGMHSAFSFRAGRNELPAATAAVPGDETRRADHDVAPGDDAAPGNQARAAVAAAADALTCRQFPPVAPASVAIAGNHSGGRSTAT